MKFAITLFLVMGLSASTLAETRTVPRNDIPPLSERGLRYRLELPKITYLLAEPIECTVWFENTTAQDQLLTDVGARDCELYHASGEPAINCGRHDIETRIQTVDSLGRILVGCYVLPPHGLSEKSQINLLGTFGRRAGFHCSYLPVDSYYLTCPKISSDTAWFKVVMPSDPRSLSALALYDSAMFTLTPPEFAEKGNKGKRNIINSQIYRYDLLCRLLTEYPDIYFRRNAELHAKLAAAYSGFGSTDMRDSLVLKPVRDIIIDLMESRGDLRWLSDYVLYIEQSDFKLLHDTATLRANLSSLLNNTDQSGIVARRARAILDYLDSLQN